MYEKLNGVFIPKGKVLIRLWDAKTGKLKAIDIVNNLVTDAGKASIADCLRGTSNKGVITYCGVGEDATAPDPANTTLGDELFRKAVSVRSIADNVATFQTYYTTEEANGALKEAGLFGDAATSTIDTGTLFCHTAIDRTKTGNDTLTLDWDLTIG